jgi:uncharacterized protein (TIGR02266 family)
MTTMARKRSTELGAFIVDLRGTVLAFDRAMERLTGWPACEIVGRDKDHAGPDRNRASRIALFSGDLDLPAVSGATTLSLNCSDGRCLEIEASVESLEGQGDRMLITARRIVSRSAGQTVREGLDRIDPLTGLPLADVFHERLAAEFDKSADSAQPLAVILADIDHLRRVNDRLGREAGDDVLAKVADILRVSVPDETQLCRLHDDDFAILSPRAGRGTARQLAASIRSTVERYPFFEDGQAPDQRITVSLGAASFPADADRPDHLLDRARDALDEARAMGRNRVWCYLRRPRVPLEVPVFFDGAEALLVGYTRDLSPSGVFVQTAAPIDIGMRCALAFALPGREDKVHVIGRVVRTVPPEFTDAHVSRVPGMGVEFERFDRRTDRRAIESWVHLHESETLRPEKLLSIPSRK